MFMKDVKSEDMEALLDFMYRGVVHIPQESLSGLLKTAEGLQVRWFSFWFGYDQWSYTFLFVFKLLDMNSLGYLCSCYLSITSQEARLVFFPVYQQNILWKTSGDKHSDFFSCLCPSIWFRKQVGTQLNVHILDWRYLWWHFKGKWSLRYLLCIFVICHHGSQ